MKKKKIHNTSLHSCKRPPNIVKHDNYHVIVVTECSEVLTVSMMFMLFSCREYQSILCRET